MDRQLSWGLVAGRVSKVKISPEGSQSAASMGYAGVESATWAALVLEEAHEAGRS
jgi:hypothetical protein